MSDNCQFDARGGAIPSPDMQLDPAACYRALKSRDARFDGRFFTAVRSTGVYCRPVCPARTPRRENCIFLPCAAAAQEAGFRPCLRCRPEAAPGTPAWQGTSATVSRGLRLIGEGALDHEGVEPLASRLGIGARHLRRLFLEHLGASPVSIAQTRRLLFAKKLISETDLPMAEVAHAAGYASIRRFNDAFRDSYGRPPRELRRHAAPESIEGGARGLVLHLAYRPPYPWPAVLGFLAARATRGVEQVTPDTYRRTFRTEEASGDLEIRWAPDRNELQAVVRYSGPLRLIRVAERLRGAFDLEADPVEIARAFAGDRRMQAALRKLPGVRVPGAWDGFELAVRAILGQQVSVAAATTLAGRVALAFGEKLPATQHPADAGPTLLFPSAEILAEGDLASVGLTRARERAIRGLAEEGRIGPAPPHPDTGPRACDRTTGRAPRHRSLDGTVHRDARAARTRRLPDQRPRTPTRTRHDAEAARRDRRVLAALEGLRRHAPLGDRRLIGGRPSSGTLAARLREPMETDHPYLDAVGAIGPPLLHALDALEKAQRHLHPPMIGELRRVLARVMAPLERAATAIEGVSPPDSMQDFANRLDQATQHAREALRGFVEPAGGPDATARILGAMRHHCQAQSALYPLRQALPPVNRYFFEPAVWERRDLLDPEPLEEHRVGLHNAHNDPEDRGGFSLFVPESYTGDPLPLVISLHGGGGHGADFLWTWLREARSRRFHLMSPTSRGPTWSLMGPDLDARAIDSMVEFVCERWAVDRAHILVTGLSDGATYALLYGLREQAPCTALAPVSGVLHPDNFGNGNMGRAKGRRIYLVHGALDWMFPIDLARAAADELRRAGADLVFREIEDLSHTYPRDENPRILEWFQPALRLPDAHPA